jgi:hypothetical protein
VRQLGKALCEAASRFFRVRAADTENAPLMKKLKSLGFAGFALFASSITMLLLMLQWTGITYMWNSSIVIGLFVGSVLVFACFVP